MPKEKLDMLKNISFVGLFLVVLGNTYTFGSFILYLLYRPIEKQYFPAEIKNKFYLLNTTIRKDNMGEIGEPLLHRPQNNVSHTE